MIWGLARGVVGDPHREGGPAGRGYNVLPRRFWDCGGVWVLLESLICSRITRNGYYIFTGT
jgi:hypothetical protein